MKITIDTKEDSREEIRKAIRMLSAIVEDFEVYSNSPTTPTEKQRSPNIFSDEPGSSGQMQSVFGNLFGDTSHPSQASQESSEEKQEQEKKPEIQIIDY